MPVLDQTTSNSYTGNGVTTVFAYTFKLLDSADVLVTVDGVVKTLTTHYTVSGVGASGGGNITFLAAPANAAEVVIQRDMDYLRETDYQDNGDLLAATLDEDIDRVVMQVQQVRDVGIRSIKIPAGETTDQLITEAAADRANKAVIFDASGNVTVSTDDFEDQLANVTAQAVAAAASASSASGSASTATTQASNASTSASNALASAVAAAASAASVLGQFAASTGAALIGWIQSGVGTVARTVQDKLRDVVSVKDFGAVGDGTTNDTAAFQAALTATMSAGGGSKKTLLVNSGTYKITSTLTVGSKQHVIFEPGVTVNLVPAANVKTTPLFTVANQSEVYFFGNGAVLGGTRTGGDGSGNACAFYLYGTDNFAIQDFYIADFATDGLIVTGDATGSGACTNGRIQNVVSTNNLRNGLSLISAISVQVIGGEYKNSNGATSGPWAGIDIEPNSDCWLEDVTIIGVRTDNNDGAGIQVTPGALSAVTNKRFHVNIIGGRSYLDGASVGVAGLEFRNGGTQTNKIYGEIVVRGFTVDSPTGRGVSFSNWDADKSPRIVLENVTVYDPDYPLGAASNVDRAGFVIYADAAQAITNLGNIIMRDCYAEDTRGTARMPWGMIVAAASGKVIKNVLIENPKSVNVSASDKYDVYTDIAGGAGTSVGFDVRYANPTPISTSGTISIAGYGGQRLNITASSALSVLAAANCKDLSYEVQVAAGINSVTITPAAGDTFEWYGAVASAAIVLDEGGYVRFRSLGGTKWRIEDIAGAWRRAGAVAPRQVIWMAAIPAAGTWAVGDRAWNSAPAVGQPKSWVCTVAGTPGTWVAEGNL